MANWDATACTISTLLSIDEILATPAPPYVSADGTTYETQPLRVIADAHIQGYNLTALPLTTEKWKQRWSDMCLLPAGSEREAEIEAEKKAEAWRARPGFMKEEVTITRLDEAQGVTILVSDWLELDSPDDWVRHDAEIALQQELAYASYLNVHSAILPAPRNRDHVASYARVVNSCLKSIPYMNLSIALPVYSPSVLNQDGPESPVIQRRDSLTSTTSGSPVLPSTPRTPRLVVPGSSSSAKFSFAAESELNATWEMWDLIRSICDYNTRLTLTLDLSPPLPTSIGVLSKWAAESVRNILIPSSTFIANSKGYPVLPKPTQNFIRDCMIHRPNIILSGAKSGNHSRGGEDAYSQYIRHLERTSPAVQAAERAGTVENFAQGYQDYLQAPLQPLMDNLQSITYQTFEQDPVKYRLYEEAMYKALVDWPEQEQVTFCVAGAGRGPLVARCLNAVGRSKRKAFIYVVEKNPNAYVTLQNRQQAEWGDKVKLLFGDMRFIDVPEQVDILVSELLGSFGDNELSPECLDGAVRFLKPNGISIPASYSAHLAPLSSSKLYNEARAAKDLKSMETPYVVMFQAVNILSGDGGGFSGKCGPKIQECWTFEHPRRDPVLDSRGLPTTNSHNARSAKMNFYIPHAGVLHGLAGYFEATLYGTVGLSIHPRSKDRISKDMLSWFPLFFPFKEPLYLPSNSELQVSIWRLTTEKQVWYEWHAESFLSSPRVINPELPRSPNGGVGNGAISSSVIGGMASPLLDADDSVFFQRQGTLGEISTAAYDTVKIGQTSLHNPGGRSSWIGL